jgi:hypothetical protein
MKGMYAVVALSVLGLAAFWIVSVSALPYEQDEVRDPPGQGTYGPLGTWSWAFLSATYNPQTMKYSNINHDGNWGMDHIGRVCDPHYYWGNDPYHPYTQQLVLGYNNSGGRWQLDSNALVSW